MVSTKFNIKVKEYNEKKKGSACNKAVNSHNHDDVDAGEVLPLEGDSDGQESISISNCGGIDGSSSSIGNNNGINNQIGD